MSKAKEVSVDDILYTLQKWHIESSSAYNDGYTIEHYKQNINKIQQLLSRYNYGEHPKVIT